jgi:hypothetical protein
VVITNSPALSEDFTGEMLFAFAYARAFFANAATVSSSSVAIQVA